MMVDWGGGGIVEGFFDRIVCAAWVLERNCIQFKCTCLN